MSIEVKTEQNEEIVRKNYNWVAYELYRKHILNRKVEKPDEQTRKRLEIYHKTFVNLLWLEIAKYNSIVVLILGLVGSGKSYAGIIEALHIDPFFTLDQVVFSKEEVSDLFERISEEKRQNPTIPRVVVWDEVGIGLHNRDWYKQEQIEIVKKLIALRTNNINIIACVPHIRYLDSAFDARINFMVEMATPNPDKAYRFGKVLKRHGFLTERKPLKFIPMRGPEGKRFYSAYLDPRETYKSLFAEYEKRREQYAFDLMQRDTEEKQGTSLTPNQTEVLRLTIAGSSVSEIAKSMGKGEQYVKDVRRLLRNEKNLLPPLKP